VQTQASTTLNRGGHAFRLGVALLFALLPLASASTRIRHNDSWARQQFARAERVREALNGRPVGERTRHEYQRVIDSYRRVYMGSPSSSKADPSVVATAELMVEMGRRFDDDKILRGAIVQYYFLRKEYPGSKYRFDALFTIAEIYKDDLNDPAEARAAFADFAHRYPRSRLAADARAAVQEIDAQAANKEHLARKAARKQRAPGAHSDGDSGGAAGSVSADAVAPAGANSDQTTESGSASASATSADARRNALPRVTGVRHWSTPDYTRVAIDIEQEVKFDSQRILRPDRIFFDLRDTTLASTLVGKTFDVDDGFLKKIRVAEFKPGRTRIVLEVDDLSSYDAFLLPDPYRLIIDIHGKQKRATMLAAHAAGGKDYSAPDDTSALPESGDVAEPAAAPVREAKSAPRKTQTESGKVALGFTKPGLVETDLPPEPGNADSQTSDPSKSVNGIGVVKTQVVVKGSTRKIPKTIVEADDHAPTTVATLEPERIRAESRMGRDSNVADSDDDKPAKLHSSLSSATTSPSSAVHRKKPRPGGAATVSDTTDLQSDVREVTREARPTAAGDRSLIRALGLKIGKIVIDPGHGGHDTGTIGPNGLLEKDVVLDVAKRLGRLLEARLGAEVIYTRQDDTFIPLETRTAIANRERADLFISIHANSSRDSDARGVETYYLNFTSSPEALEVAARENAVSEKSIHELQDLVKKIALKEKIDESREFAGDVQQSLYGGLSLDNAGIRNRGIKKAPFIVLIGANMPSILAEISFVSNPTDERKMETAEHRQRIAESLYRGVSKYASGLSGVKVASKIDKPEGQ